MAQNNFVTEIDLTFDNPVKYKDITLYPVTVKDYFDFYISIACLTLDQYNDEDAIDNYEIYTMSYLDYIFNYNDRHQDSYMDSLLIRLLSVCMRIDFNDGVNEIKLFYDGEKKRHFLRINDVDIDHKDFDNIRHIVCQQNNIDISIFDLDPLVRKNLQKTIQLQNASRKNNMCSLEDQIVAIMITTSLNQETINNLTIRKFRKILDRVDHKMHYEIYTLASKSGFVTMKSEYPHWLNKIDKDVSKNITSYDEVKKKINMSNSDLGI